MFRAGGYKASRLQLPCSCAIVLPSVLELKLCFASSVYRYTLDFGLLFTLGRDGQPALLARVRGSRLR